MTRYLLYIAIAGKALPERLHLCSMLGIILVISVSSVSDDTCNLCLLFSSGIVPDRQRELCVPLKAYLKGTEIDGLRLHSRLARALHGTSERYDCH